MSLFDRFRMFWISMSKIPWIYAPYGQTRIAGAAESTLSRDSLKIIDGMLQEQGRSYFQVMEDENLDAVLSMNNFNAGVAAAGQISLSYRTYGLF